MKELDTKRNSFEGEFGKILKERAGFKKFLERKLGEIFSAIENDGEKALLDYARKFDGFSGSARDIRVSNRELNSAIKFLSREEISAIKFAKKRIEKFHRRQVPKGYSLKEDGSTFEERWIPLNSVGIYIPGGKAPLASTVLMTAIPARLAGVKRIVIVTPAGKGGTIHPAILFCAKLVGVNEIFKIGGAHSIAGLALGAGALKKVDKIVGPGGVWASSAKIYAHSQGLVGIDTLAGPSEILILSDGSAPVEFAISDLSAQLEHGEGGWAFLISMNSAYLEKVKAGVNFASKNLVLIKCGSRKEMIEITNRIAPEHLEIHLKNPEKILPLLSGPSAIYIGAYSPTAIGDYVAGTNHCLPTAGRAIFDSPLSVYDFMKRQSIVRLSKKTLKKLFKPAIDFAEMEGLKKHGSSIEIRL